MRLRVLLPLAGAALLAAAALALLLRPDGEPAVPPGPVPLVAMTAPATDAVIDHPDAARRAALRRRFSRVMAYAPFFDARTAWAPPALVYQDLYAVYPQGDGSLPPGARVLRDAAGAPLAIPWGCGSGRCPQYAGDVFDPAFREAWIERARAALAHGYRGVWIDDVNLDVRVSDLAGGAATAVVGGRPLGVRAWRDAMAAFAEEVRAALPHAELVHNVIWFAGRDTGAAAGEDPAVRRELAAADAVNLERGCTDPGLRGDGGAYSLDALLRFVDAVHALGPRVIWQPHDTGRPDVRETNLACLLLTRRGGDALATDVIDPADGWPGWSLDPGPPEAPRERQGRVWVRRSAGALALVAEPGPAVTVRLPAGDWRTLAGARAPARLTLAGGTGRALAAGAWTGIRRSRSALAVPIQGGRSEWGPLTPTPRSSP